LSGAEKGDIEKVVRQSVRLLKREDIENREAIILEPAQKKKVGLLIPGDPLISTTHVSLLLSAKELGIRTKIVHNASIISAATSKSGMQNYKFGMSASIPFPFGFVPETPYNVLKQNLGLGLHTLLFLDIENNEKKKCMTVNQAIEYLLNIEKKRKENVFTHNTLCIALCNIGSDKEIIRADKAKKLLKLNFGSAPHCLIVPGKLHFMEKEYLKEFAELK